MISFIYPGLTLRRSFWLVDLSVAVVCAMLVAHVVMRFYFPQPPEIDSGTVATAETPKLVAHQIPKGEIDRIGKNPVFGSASTMSTPVKEPPPPKPEPIDPFAESSLKLDVKGIVWDEDPMRSSCVIVNSRKRETETYSNTDEVTTGVFVAEIWPTRVILDEHGKRTYLEWEPEDNENGGTKPVRAAAPSKPRPSPLPRVMELSRAEMSDRADDIMALRDSVEVQPYKQNGRVVGLQVGNLGDNPMAADIGIEDGDVVQSINSVRINDMDTAVEQLTKLSNAPMIRVGIMRNGQRTFLTYRIR